ncbi:hypothetical protein GUJ93_ZPchr0008g12919 [Zizania palustris]|uniref:Uncharacterized protein n=1 Tax=Zizania palustris TaxID=103762 RepID=A0A8J5R6E7_ZIZPA|nr:hypothetical protein GUJ93_ZPchr0008g12919 [Zizania palustris]
MPATECTNSVNTLAIGPEISVVADDVAVRDGSSSSDPGISETRLIELGFLRRRTAAAIDKAAISSSTHTASKDAECLKSNKQSKTLEPSIDDSNHGAHENSNHAQSHFPFSNLLPNIWPGHDRNFKAQGSASTFRRYDASINNDLQVNPLLPKITMVGISMGEGGQMKISNVSTVFASCKALLIQIAAYTRLTY